MTQLRAPLFAHIRSADWLDAPRARRVARVALVAAALALVLLVAFSDGMRDYQGRPLGSDFFSFWSAGKMALAGDAAAAYDMNAHYAEHQRLLDDSAPPFYPFLYPPSFLVVAAGLAKLPYLAAWLVWMGAGLAAYLAAIGGVARKACDELKGPLQSSSRARRGASFVTPCRLHPEEPSVTKGEGDRAPQDEGAIKNAILLAAAFPAVFVNFAHGQNGFLLAALFAGALLLLDRRPLIAGALFGLLAFKPQYGLLIPLVLASTGRWRVFAAATAVVLMEIVATIAIFGANVWPAFLDGAQLARSVVLDGGAVGWEKIQSVFAALRALGAPLGLAYAAQGLTALAAAAGAVWLWRSAAAPALKAAGLVLAALLATPYVVDYDLVLLAPAIAFLGANAVAAGFRPYEKMALAFAWAAPIIARPVAEATFLPLGLFATLALFGLVLTRARAEEARKTDSNQARVIPAEAKLRAGISSDLEGSRINA